MGGADLVVVVLPGVQRFISESRTTADAAAASAIVSRLTNAMISRAGHDVVFPVVDAVEQTQGVPNRIVVRCAAGDGERLARELSAAVGNEWARLCLDASPGSARVGEWRLACAEAVGFPAVQWVVAPAVESSGYAGQWESAITLTAARRRTAVFPPYDVSGRRVCGMSGRWAAVSDEVAQAVVRAGRVRLRRGEVLSVPALVKRVQGRNTRMPSTWSVATAPFRSAVARCDDERLRAAVDRLLGVVGSMAEHGVRAGGGEVPGLPGGGIASMEGAWLFPDTWVPSRLARDNGLSDDVVPDEVCREGRAAAQSVTRLAGDAGIAAPTPYLAVLAQDADRMGERLSWFPAGVDPVRWHREVSARLVASAREQTTAMESGGLLGRVVYAGGDDLLGLLPVATAFTAAQAVNAAFVAGVAQVVRRATASTAVVFFHASSPLQPAFAAARDLLDQAKAIDRPGFGVGVLRRGGVRTTVARPWADTDGNTAVSRLMTLVEAMRPGHAGKRLSGRLASSLERDHDQFGRLSREWRRREVARLVARHGARVDDIASVTEAVLALGHDGPDGDGPGQGVAPTSAVLAARFVAAEGR